MKALIVYDSYFGNTEQVAQAIATALGSSKDVGILRVGKVKSEQLKGLKLLIVGSPTRAFNPTTALKNFLRSVPKNSLNGVRVAAFDTRISQDEINSGIISFLVKLFGYAAKPIAGKLKKKGGELVVSPEGFFVQDTEGPLKEGELERAAKWAEQIISA